MSNKCPTCSQTGAERSNPQGEARCGEPASRNASELDSASLHKVGAANLPELPKPATVGEATLERSRQAPRGDWRQRAGKEKSRNLRTEAKRRKPAVGSPKGERSEANPAWATAPCRESEDPIVARKGLKSLERRGSAVSAQLSKQNATA